MYVYNPFGQPIAENNLETEGSRIGRRIRAIRTEEGLSQTELGEKVGLNANRIQQYENGARKPKFELSKKIAEALEVEESALLDPVVANYLGAMYAFFEMEKLYDLRLKIVEGQVCVCFGESQNDMRVSTMNKNLMIWLERRKKLEEEILNADSEEEKKRIIHKYHMWEWNFPYSTDENAPLKSERVKKERAAREIEELLLSDRDGNNI